VQANGNAPSGERSSAFDTTRWTIILRAGRDDPFGGEALEQLCRQYWLPLYVYVRRRGHSLHDAEDLTQAFLADVLRRGVIGRADPTRGKFRTYLLTALVNFLHNAHDHAQAARRGGATERVSFDAAGAADALAQIEADGLPPDRAFDRGWVLALLDRALRRLRAEQERVGKVRWFERVLPLLQSRPGPGEYEAIAAEFGQTKNSVAVAVHRLNLRFRELVRAEVADTVESPEQLQSELRDLLGSLSS
jgi:RNA polymerase sigma-70 factor (ECF subfamily)